jgi:hypothetical protein
MTTAALGSSCDTPAEQARLRVMQQRDVAVHRHERAHQAVAGQFAGTATYTRVQGPDGKVYASGGEVPIDLAPVRADAEATIAKMRLVIAAALAPADPSPQDRAVAARAASQLQAATRELQRGSALDVVA